MEKKRRNRFYQIEERETKLRKDYPRTAQCCFLEKKINFTVNVIMYISDRHCNVTT